MRKIIISTKLLLFIIFLDINSQNLLFEKDMKLVSYFKDHRETLPIDNKDNSKLTLVFFDKSYINFLVFNEKLDNTIDSYIFKRPMPVPHALLGNTYKENNYYLYFANDKIKNNISKLFVLHTSLNNKKNDYSQLPINFKKEPYLESFDYENSFYIITVKKNSSVIKLHVLKNNSIINVKEIDLTDFQFSNYKTTKLSQILINDGLERIENIILPKIRTTG